MSPNLKRPRLDSNTAKLELSYSRLNEIKGIHNMQRHHAGMSVICHELNSPVLPKYGCLMVLVYVCATKRGGA